MATRVNHFVEATGPTDWIIEDVVPAAQKGLVAAPPGSGKNWLTEAMALSVASGGDFLGRYRVVSPRMVLLVDQDTPRPVLAERFGALGDISAIPLAIASHTGIAADKPAGQKQLDGLLAKHHPALVILETLETITSGDFNENSAAEVGGLFEGIDALVARHGCTVIITHHLSKRREGDNPLSWLRGSGALPARIDFGYAMRPMAYMTGANKRFIVLPFTKRVRTPPAFEIELETREAEGKLDAASLRWIRDWDAGVDPDVIEMSALVLEVARDSGKQGVTVNELLKSSEGYLSDRDVRDLLDALRRQGLVARGREAHGRFRFWAAGLAPKPRQSP